jgi:hypothetical protein
MHTIGTSQLWSFSDHSQRIAKLDNTTIRKSKGHRVKSFLDLAKKISALQFKNPDHVLLFRGQDFDHKNLANNASLKPALFRPETIGAPPPAEWILQQRFDRLARAEKLLSEEFSNRDLEGADRLRRHRILRWTILQHYEVCATPLLDVTHSLRIAASFASLSRARQAWLYVVGVPNLSGAITASAEAGLQIVRLASVCPPNALRPHIQEGYLLGEYPDMPELQQKQHYASAEIDFGRRLIAKFRFSPATFWSDATFPMVAPLALYPDKHDQLLSIATRIKAALGNEN